MADIFDRTSEIGGEAAVKIGDAGVFAFLLPDISEVSGQVNGEMTVTGNLQLPEILGSISLSDAGFRARQTGVQIRDLNLTLEQRAPGQLQLRGNALSGDGQVVVSGDTTMGSDTGIRTELQIEGKDFEVARLPNLAVTASPNLAVVFDDRLTSVTGELEIPRADIVVRSLPETAVSPSRDAVVHRAGIAPEDLRRRRTDVDVLASLGEQISFSGFGLTAGVEGGLRIRGGTHAPFVGAGQLVLRDGRYKAYGQDLEIERGELIFNGPLDNPQLDVRATRKAGDVTAGIRLNGTPENLRSEVFSEPALSDAETLSYLLTGRPLSGGGADGDTLNKAAFALGLSGAGKVASQVRAGLGLETLQIEGGADDGRIIAGKRFGSRLMVEYGYGIIDKLGTLLLRYQLNNRLILESRTGTVSNLDIVYSVKRQ
jgi:translocation and assembly module TamB